MLKHHITVSTDALGDFSHDDPNGMLVFDSPSHGQILATQKEVDFILGLRTAGSMKIGRAKNGMWQIATVTANVAGVI